MDEARRFLRYVMPGIVYGVETVLLLLITCPTWIQSITSNLGKDNLGTVLGSMLVFGGLGFIFSTIHHACHCSCNMTCDENDRILDHRLIATQLKAKGIAKHLDDEEVADPEIAMAISYQHWHNQMDIGHIGDSTNKKVSSLGDQSHGLGTVYIASLASYLTTIMICATELRFESVPSWRLMLMVVLWFWITHLFMLGYQRLGKIAHKTYEMALKDALSKPQEKLAN